MKRYLSVLAALLFGGATMAAAVDQYKTVTLVHTEQEGFTTSSSYDAASDTHYMRVTGGKIGAIFKWEGEHSPEVTQSSYGGNVHLNFTSPSGIGNCCIIAYTRWPSDWDFACDAGCADCGCMLCFGWPGCQGRSFVNVEFGPRISPGK